MKARADSMLTVNNMHPAALPFAEDFR